MSDDEVLSGFLSLHEAMQRGFARLEHRTAARIDALEERLKRLESALRDRGITRSAGRERFPEP